MHKIISPIILSASIFLAACVTQAELPLKPLPVAPSASTSSEQTSAAPVLPVIPTEERMQSGGILQLGKTDAPVSMLLFINHSSEYSQAFHETIIPRLMADYVATGKVGLGIVPMQFIRYPESNMSAGLLICATLQGKGQAMNDLLFSRVNPALLQKNILALGLDMDLLKACLGNDPMKKQMDAAAELIQSFSITTAPAYVINGAVYTGLPEYADLRGQIELASAKKN